MAKCFVCNANFSKVALLLDHLEERHADSIPDDMSVGKYYYAQTHNGITEGQCQICKKPTEFDEKTRRPFVLCTDPTCKQKSAERARANISKAYGTANLTESIEHQKKMQAAKKAHGVYKFPDGGEVGYLNKLELGFLQFCDNVLEFKSYEIEEMGVVLKYNDETGRERNYILDYYLNMYNTIVEIKEGGDNPNTHPNYIANTKNKEKYKDIALLKQSKYNVIKIYNNDFRPLVRILFKIKDDMMKNNKMTKQFVDIEDKVANSFYLYESANPVQDYRDLYLVEVREKYTQSLITYGITDTMTLRYLYLPVADFGFVQTSPVIKPFRNASLIVNKFNGNKDNLDHICKTFNGETIMLQNVDAYSELLKVLYDSKIMVDIDDFLVNNDQGKHDFSLMYTVDDFTSLKQIDEVLGV